MSQRPSVQATISTLLADVGAYDPRVLEALAGCHDVSDIPGPPQEIDVNGLEPGMVVFDDVLTSDDVLLISRGTVVTDTLILRLENYVRQDRVGRRLRVQG
jgi:hypothetical protein